MFGFYEFKDLEIGMRVSAEGKYDGKRCLRASTISIKHDGELDEMEGFLEVADAERKVLRLFDLDFALEHQPPLSGADKQPLAIEALASGMRIKTKGDLQSDGRFRPAKIKLKAATPDAQDEIEGTISAIDPERKSLTIMGFDVRCDDETQIEE